MTNEIQERQAITEKPDAILRIRRVRPEDIPQIWELHRNGMNQYRVGIREVARRRFYNDLLNPDQVYYQQDGELIVVKYKGQIIGMGGFKKIDDRVCEFVRFSVARPYQSCGVGKLILTTLVQLAAQKGYTDFTLRTSVRQEAAKFYEAAERFFEVFERGNSPELDEELRKVGALDENEKLELITMLKDMSSIDFLRHLFDNNVIFKDPRIAIDFPGIPVEVPKVNNWKDNNNKSLPIPIELLVKNNLQNVPRDLDWVVQLVQRLGPKGEQETREYVDKMMQKLQRKWFEQQRHRRRKSVRDSIKRGRKFRPRTYHQLVTPTPQQMNEIRSWAKVVQKHWGSGTLEDRKKLAGRFLPNKGTTRARWNHR